MTTPTVGTAEHAKLLTRGAHPGIQSAMAWLAFSHLPLGLQPFAEPLYRAGMALILAIDDSSAELTTSLNRLVEAKDWAVRAGIRYQQGQPGPVPRPAIVVDPPAEVAAYLPTFPAAQDVADERWGTVTRDCPGCGRKLSPGGNFHDGTGSIACVVES